MTMGALALFDSCGPAGTTSGRSLCQVTFLRPRNAIGIDDNHCFLIDDESVSRSHLELHLDTGQDQAWLVDRSTNGTWLNGARMGTVSASPDMAR